MTSILLSKIRGIEQEVPVSVENPNYSQKSVIGLGIQGLIRSGYLTGIGWDHTMETGNLEYERDLYLSGLSGILAKNGSRVYDDLGHLEISSPSYNNPLDAVAYNHVSQIFSSIASSNCEKSTGIRTSSFANNTLYTESSIGLNEMVSFGTHGNYVMKRENMTDWNKVIESLVPYMVSRILITGSGEFLNGKLTGHEGYKYVISPRAHFIKKVSSPDTMHSRGILNTRDEPHLGREYWRLHDIHFEALKCDYAVFMRDALQTFVLSAFEAGKYENPPEIYDPVKTMKSISLDTNDMKWEVPLRNGKKTDAPEVLRYYLNGAENLLSEKDHDSFDSKTFKSLDALVGKLESRSVEDLELGIDWLFKKSEIEERFGQISKKREPKASDGLDIVRAYSLCDESSEWYVNPKINPDDEMYACIFDFRQAFDCAKYNLGFADWDGMRERTIKSLTHGPETTRDYFRSLLANKFEKNVRSANWGNIVLKDKIVYLEKPFMLNKDELKNYRTDSFENLISDIRRNQDATVLREK